MKRTWTIIGVADVPQSFKWYQSLLGLPEMAPAHDYFGQIVDSDGTVLLCLHEWGAHEHPSLTSPHYAKPDNGLLLFFRVDNFEVALPRARALVSRLEEEPRELYRSRLIPTQIIAPERTIEKLGESGEPTIELGRRACRRAPAQPGTAAPTQ
jgi:catechol 2,3-dioxygenase-like lactoylglutathione lyase family enzyme